MIEDKYEVINDLIKEYKAKKKSVFIVSDIRFL